MKVKTNMKLIATSLIISVLSIFGYYNFLPVEPIASIQDENLGASLTTINGSDKIKDSRTVINDNFTALNSAKIEISTSTLPNITTLANLATVGTIGTGTWNADAIGVGYGGTGTTTPTSNMVMIGDGSNGLKVIGFGTSGQFLTSGGAGTAPSWSTSSIDEAGNYNWTGIHTGIGITGEIIAYASSTVPVGWLAADGSAVSTSTYSTLFDLIGYTYGGSGATFNLPDLSGRNIIGYGSATTTIDEMGETGGEMEHTQTIDEMPAHSHTINKGGTTNGSGVILPPERANVDGSYTTNSTGGGTAFNVLDPYIVLQYIIKY